MRRAARRARPSGARACRRWSTSPAPTARAPAAPSSARWPRRPASASTSTPRRTWCASTSASAWPARWSTRRRWKPRWTRWRQRNAGAPITVFEITTAAALLLFSRVPADLLVLEVGLGGRYDATNVVDRPAATAITSISMDHMEFLGDTLEEIARGEGRHPQARRALRRRRPTRPLARAAPAAAAAGAPLLARGRDWRIEAAPRRAPLRRRRGRARPAAALARRAAPGGQCRHRGRRAAGVEPALADAPTRSPPGVAGAEWPARMQRLGGRLAALAAGGLGAVARRRAQSGRRRSPSPRSSARGAWRRRSGPIHLVVGMKSSQGGGGLPGAAAAAAGRHALGGGGAGPARRHAGRGHRRRERRHGARRGRPWPRRWQPCRAAARRRGY